MHNERITAREEKHEGKARKPIWRKPEMSSDPVADATRLNYTPGIDSLFEGSSPATGAS